ncbi:MAG: hypothetical protein GY794_19175 [bacterium]|nr:hypothetical protein [bacterium]
MRKTIICPGFLVVLCMLSGCAWFSGASNPGAVLAAVDKPLVHDLPVPVDFKFDSEASEGSDSGANRRIYHVYWGSASKYAVARFYERAMVAEGWRFIEQPFSAGDQNLRFNKPGAKCRVYISSGSWLHPTKLRLELWTSETINHPANDPKTGQ